MSSQRYQRVDTHDDSDGEPDHSRLNAAIPSSPPPSFHSRSSSPSSRRLLHDEPSRNNEADTALTDAFGAEDESDADEEPDDRQRLMRANPESRTSTHNINEAASSSDARTETQSESHGLGTRGRSGTVLPTFSGSTAPSGRVINSTNDGVFANLAAKPERGEKTEDLPPVCFLSPDISLFDSIADMDIQSYEEAAADATPPYWETTILAPGISSDEVYVDGLPVGSIFSFVWNAMISMSFQLVGFLLTYLLHTTHAAKNGSRAGLGLTLVQYGFYMKGSSETRGPEDGGSDPYMSTPPDPNSHNFDPNSVSDNSAAGTATEGSSGLPSISTGEWISYVLMVVGWFILIRAVSDFLRARRHEQLVLQSPDRGLPVPVVAEGERSETVV
ncbi:hypothetical protein MAP00_001073 [Monascus purpureus]|nr:hypothetical protein MAP00_001073 [Monascus purpureus]